MKKIALAVILGLILAGAVLWIGLSGRPGGADGGASSSVSSESGSGSAAGVESGDAPLLGVKSEAKRS